MATRHPAAAAGTAVSTVVALLVVVVVVVVVVVACQLPRANGGGVTVQALDGTTTAALGQCAAEEQELVRKPTTAKYISYGALRADQIPCNKPGHSYYTNCAAMQQANPYTRGCSAITRCARNMN